MVCVVEVIVTKMIDTTQPFWVECKMKDVHGEEHIFQDKMPVFLKKHITEADLPAIGGLRCVIINRNAEVIRIDTSKPDDVETISGKTIFEVSIHKLSRRI